MNCAGAFERRGRGFGEAEISNLAHAHELRHRADGFLDRRSRIDTVQIVKIDGVDAEPLEACVASGADVFGASVDSRDRSAMAHESELGGEEDVLSLVFG